MSIWYEFIESTAFTRRIEEFGHDVLLAIQRDLISDPLRWPVIQGTYGARKGRVGDSKSGRGKRGSFRYVYLYVRDKQRIHLLVIYAKGEQTDLSPAQRRALGKVIRAIEKE